MGAEAGRVCGVGANQSFSARSLFRKSIRGLSAGKLETQARSSWLVDIKLTGCTVVQCLEHYDSNFWNIINPSKSLNA